MADTDCPNCGNKGRLATNHSLDWYKCTTCREQYEVSHTTCAHSGCASWVDDEESGLCHFHNAQQGRYPEGEPFQADHERGHK
jgi:hypothetical protein